MPPTRRTRTQSARSIPERPHGGGRSTDLAITKREVEQAEEFLQREAARKAVDYMLLGLCYPLALKPLNERWLATLATHSQVKPAVLLARFTRFLHEDKRACVEYADLLQKHFSEKGINYRNTTVLPTPEQDLQVISFIKSCGEEGITIWDLSVFLLSSIPCVLTITQREADLEAYAELLKSRHPELVYDEPESRLYVRAIATKERRRSKRLSGKMTETRAVSGQPLL